MSTSLEIPGVGVVTWYPSAGADGATVIQIDTIEEPNNIRVNMNDGRVWGRPHSPTWFTPEVPQELG